jgi:hypothetical protein
MLKGGFYNEHLPHVPKSVISHPAPRVSEWPHRNVPSVDAVTACASFVSKDAIVAKCSEDQPALIRHDIRVTVHTQRCVLCVRVCWNWLDLPYPPAAWLTRPQLNGLSTDHRRSMSVLSEARENLPSISVLVRSVSVYQCSPWPAAHNLSPSLFTQDTARRQSHAVERDRSIGPYTVFSV